MHAIVITQHGGAEVLKLQDRPDPTVAPDEVLIKVKAAGINRPDIFQRKGNYPAPKGVPADIPGLEVAGIIEQVGQKVDQWKPGDAVCALIAGGGYAEKVVAPAKQCLPMPENMSFAEAASLPETVFTVWSNVFQRASLKPKETFLVHGGTSGIGVMAIQTARAFGAKVISTSGTDKKCEACHDLGADICINYKTQDFAQELKDEGIDVILDMVGGNYFEKNIDILNPEGRLVHINAMKGIKVELNILKIMQKRLFITGSTLRSRDKNYKARLAAEIQQKVWPLFKNGIIKPVIYKTFPLHKASDAHALMEKNVHIGKLILTVD
ncbi:MAG: NAD(P)H-quinone oxidoreductase [Fulvivirga sp.]|nr:NAD(P)H-quinone oxidoreductase [Fulvivirga sp.]